MSFQNPHLAPQKDTLSVASETVPLYHLGAIKQEVASDESCCHEDGSQLISLSGILETAFNNQAESGTTNATFTSVFDGSSSSITHGCPDNCPCVCHVPAPHIPFNQERPSVIMTPVAGRRRASGATSTHAPLQVRTDTVHYNWTTQVTGCWICYRLGVCTSLLVRPVRELSLFVPGWGARGGGEGGEYSVRTSNSWSYFRPENVISGGSLYKGSASIEPDKNSQNRSRKSQQITQCRSSNFVGEAVWNIQIFRLLV